MLFLKVEARDSNGVLLQQDETGLFLCTWNNNISELITLEPIIDAEGDHQNIRLVTTIIEEDFYEFSTDNGFQRESHFPSANGTSFTFKLKRKPQQMERPPCRLRNTIFFTVIDGVGINRKRQISENLFIQ
jgi:hypothetical protein